MITWEYDCTTGKFGLPETVTATPCVGEMWGHWSWWMGIFDGHGRSIGRVDVEMDGNKELGRRVQFYQQEQPPRIQPSEPTYQDKPEPTRSWWQRLWGWLS